MIKKKSIDLIYMGPEPMPSGPYYHEKDTRLSKFFNWYNYFYTIKDSREWIVTWMKANKYTWQQLSAFSKVSDNQISMTSCSLARIVNNGGKLNEILHKRLTDHIAQCIASVAQEKLKRKPMLVAVSVADRTKEKALDILAHVESELDNLFSNGYKSEFSMYDYLKGADAKPVMAKYIKDAYKPLLQEINEVAKGKDKDLVEGYANLKPRQLTNYLKFVTMIVSDSEKYFENRVISSPRKPRAKKPVNNADLLKTFNYLPEYKELKIVSFQPINIFDATSVWIYNTKYKKLTVLRAEEGKKLSVKGTTIVNFDPNNSMCKTVRKPAETLKAVSDSGKVPLRTFMQTLTTIPSPVTGRVSEDVILLRYVK